MFNKLKNSNLFRGLFIAFVIGVILLTSILILAKDWFHNSNTKIKCGNGVYAQYKNIEGGNYMYNITNERMRFRSIFDYYNDTIESNPIAFLYIKNNSSSVLFIPEKDNLVQNDIDNLTSCYPDSSMELQYNFRNNKIREGVYEEIKDSKRIK